MQYMYSLMVGYLVFSVPYLAAVKMVLSGGGMQSSPECNLWHRDYKILSKGWSTLL